MTAGPAAAEHAAPFDALLSDAALGPIRRWLPGPAGARLLGSLASRPRTVAGQLASLGTELAKVARGSSELEPAKGDRRFTDQAWAGNPVLHRILQAYLATGRTVESLVDDAGLDWRTTQRLRFLADNLVAAASPSNSPLLNPAVLKATIDTGGRNFVRGLGHLVGDLATPPRIPTMVDRRAFTVGENLAMTPGVVVLRTPVFELLQYAPQTATVRNIPLLLIPPTINKYYIADLAPGRSMIEHFVQSGQQVFAVSWRNPDARHAEWGLDTYGQAVLDALTAVEAITGSERTVLLGLCSGGMICSMVMGYLAAVGDLDRIAGLTLGVTVLDESHAGFADAALDPKMARLAAARSARRGYLDGRALAELFAWLRPDDLVWNYWVNNYLLGQDPPAFDILYWNADTTRMAAKLHADFLHIGLENTLVTPGAAKLLGQPVDLTAVKTDAYVVAGIADHICPWESCYRTTQLLGGDTRFVLSTSGHIAALVNPPTKAKARFRVSDSNPVEAGEWLVAARTETGSWWEHYVGWLKERSGPDRDAPAELGGTGHPVLGPAPGTYVCEK